MKHIVSIKITQLESSHGTIVPRKFAELGGTKWKYVELLGTNIRVHDLS